MKQTAVRLLYIIFFICVYCHTTGQPFNLTTYRVADGLPSGYIESAMEDSRGYLWLCTAGGISRFDGKNFVNFDVKDGLPVSHCDEIIEDRNGCLWISTRFGLSMFNGKKFTNYSFPDTNVVTYFSNLRQDKDGVIRCLANGLIYRIQNNKLVQDHNPSGFEDSMIWNHIVLANGLEVIILRYDAYVRSKDGRIQFLMGQYGAGVLRCRQDPNDKEAFYFVCPKGLFHWKNGNIKRITDLHFEGLLINAFYIDKEGRIWISQEEKGVWVVKNETIFFIDAFKDLPGYLIPGFFQDSQGTNWICTFRGLVKATDKFIIEASNDNGLSSGRDIRSSGTLRGERLFFGNNIIQKGKIYSYPPLVISYLKKMKYNGSIRGIVYDEKERLWLFNLIGEIFRFDGRKIENLTKKFGSPVVRCENYFDSTTNIFWLGRRNMIVRYRNDSVLDTISKLNNGFQFRNIASIRKDVFGNFWFRDRDKIILYDGETAIDFTDRLELPHWVDVDMSESDSSGVWFRTEGFGAIHFKHISGNIYKKDIVLDKTNGLPNNQVTDIVRDNDNYLWVATYSGLFRVNLMKPGNKRTYNVYPILASEGLNIANWDLSYLEKEGDNVWIGGADGLFKIETKKFNTTTGVPVVKIVNVEASANSEWTSSAQDHSKWFSLPKEAVFKYNQNNITFTFQGINLRGGYIRYAYMLEGQDKDWHTNQSFNKAVYNNLSPGRYVFKVKATNEYGVEDKDDATFSFEITPAFWQTWWFRLIVGTIGIITIYFFVRRREHKIQKRNDLILHMSELKLMALQSQMNPHFIFNSLNSIQNYIIQKKPVEAAKYLSAFSKLIRRILDHSFNLLEPLNSAIETTRMYVEIEAFRFNNEFQYIIELKDEGGIGYMELPPMLLQPFVENAIIHGLMPKEGNKLLQIMAEDKGDSVLISIEDNGVGRKANVQKRVGHVSRGEKIVKDMLATLQSLYGTAPDIGFIDKKDAYGNATGTRVEIRIPKKHN